jgi:hypothetical protein
MRVPCKLSCPDNVRVGVTFWLGCGFVAFLLARLIPLARRGWTAELVVTLAAALLLGALATALDFGGWRELDWRAGLFAFFGSFAAAGTLRAVQSAKPTGGHS